MTERFTSSIPQRSNALSDLAIGATAGLAATAVMAAMMQLAPRLGFDPRGKDAAGRPQIGSPEAASESADILSRAATGQRVPADARMAATSAFQFAFGAGLGACYALAARQAPAITRGRGMLLGTAIFAAFDELLVPASGLSGKPQDSRPAVHAGALGAHLVFGIAVEGVRRGLVRR